MWLFYSTQELEDMLEAYEQQEKDFMEREQVLLDKLQTAPSKEKLVCTHYHLHLLLCYSLLSKIFCPNIILFNPQTYANFKMRQVYEINVMWFDLDIAGLDILWRLFYNDTHSFFFLGY